MSVVFVAPDESDEEETVNGADDSNLRFKFFTDEVGRAPKGNETAPTSPSPADKRQVEQTNAANHVK